MVKANYQSYAIAIFALAKDQKQKELFFDQIKQIDQIVKLCPDFKKVISSRTISKTQRKQIVGEILNEMGFDKIVIHWIWAIIDDNNFHNLHYIFNEVDKQHQQIFKITKVIVTSAKDLTDSQITKIKNSLTSVINTEIELVIKIRPEVIGGLKIQINNKTYNDTFARKLKDLKIALLAKKGN